MRSRVGRRGAGSAGSNTTTPTPTGRSRGGNGHHDHDERDRRKKDVHNQSTFSTTEKINQKFLLQLNADGATTSMTAFESLVVIIKKTVITNFSFKTFSGGLLPKTEAYAIL
jgi:hypothetical protein